MFQAAGGGFSRIYAGTRFRWERAGGHRKRAAGPEGAGGIIPAPFGP